MPFSIVGRVIGWMLALVIATTAPAPAAAGLAVCVAWAGVEPDVRRRLRPVVVSTRTALTLFAGARILLRVGRGRARAALGRREARLLLLERGQPPLFALAVVVDGAVDVDALGDRVGAERVVVPDDDVGVLAGFERADAAVDAQLLRRVDRHHRERFVLGQPAPLHRLGRLGVEAARVLGAVGVDRDEHALAHHDRGVVRDGVGRLDLVGPPVGEGRAAGAVRGHLLRHHVALEHVLEGRDLEAHLLGETDHHQDFVGAVAVRVHEALALEDLDERLELQIAARRQRSAAGLVLLVVLPRLLVRLGAREGVADDELDAHARHRVAPRAGGLADRHVLRVLAERELDPRHRALEDDLLGARLAPAQLDHLVLAADRVGAAVQDVGDGQAAGEIAIDVDVGRIDDVFHPRHRADRRPALVDRVVGDVRVRVDDARRHELAGGVDDLGAGGNLHVGADRGDLAVAQEHGAVRNRAPGDGEHRAAAKCDDPGLRGLAGLALDPDGSERCQNEQSSKGQKYFAADQENLQVKA